MKIYCVSLTVGLAIGSSAVAEPKPQTDPTIPREELRKMVADYLSERRPPTREGHAIPTARMQYVGAKQASALSAPARSQQFDIPPRFISGDAPDYPIKQLMKGQPGAAVIGFTIDERGNTKEFVIIGSTYHFFATYAIRAVQHWKFEPARKNGKPVAVKVRVPFVYDAR